VKLLCGTLAALACLAAPAAVSARAEVAGDAPRAAASARTAIFYYSWFGTPAEDGAYQHWEQGGHAPPVSVGSSYYPARGPYSSSDALVLGAQMQEIAGAGVGTVIVSWWGRGSVEDQRLPRVLGAARAAGLEVAAHLEPYGGRTVGSTAGDVEHLRALGVSDFYVWASVDLPDEEWRELNGRLDGVRVFANTNLPGKAAAGGFDGVYTYDVLLYDGRFFPRYCAQARRLKLLCAPSVGPGYDARRATPDTRLRPRQRGATYDSMWQGAIRARADIWTITSYNEWHEGTQIEAARAGAGYLGYDGAWGRTGAAAETAYLDRTAFWAAQYAARVG
jgi:Glycosyl hydrolase family 99